MRLVEDRRVLPPFQLGDVCPFCLKVIEILQEEDPGGLLDIVQLGRCPLFGAEGLIDVVEGVFEHGLRSPVRSPEAISVPISPASTMAALSLPRKPRTIPKQIG